MDEKREKQNHKVTLFAILLSVISLGVLVFGFTIVSSDKVVMLQSLSNLYNKANLIFEDDLILLDKIASTDKVGINSKNTLTVGDDQYNLNLNYLENASDKLSTLNMSLFHDEDSLSTSLVFDKDHRYFSIKDITPDYYYYEEENYSYNNVFRSLSSNDYDKVLSLLKEVVDNQIDNSKIKKEKVVINYDGKDKKVNKLTYEIDYNELKTIVTKIVANILKDKELYNNISNVLNGKDGLRKYLDEYLDNFKDINGNILSYSTYYYGFNKIVQYEFHSNVDNITLNYKEDKTNDDIRITKDEDTLLNINIDKATNKYTFNGNLSYFIKESNLNDTWLFDLLSNNFSGTYNNKNLELNIETETPLRINFSFTNGVLDGVYKYNTNLKVMTKVDEEEKEMFNLVSEIEFIFDKKIDVDITDSILITNDSEEEKQMNELLKTNPIYQEIISKIN